MSVRPAIPSDGPAIAEIHREKAGYYAELAPELFKQPEEESLLAFIEPGPADNDRTHLFAVAEREAGVVGYIYAELSVPTEADRFHCIADLTETRLFINALSVSQATWRQGVATELVEAAEAWGRERGAISVFCDTWPSSPVSSPFWTQRIGYETRSVRLEEIASVRLPRMAKCGAGMCRGGREFDIAKPPAHFEYMARPPDLTGARSRSVHRG